jgi:membrane protein YdbS with pleckstrin-like domain
MKQVYCKEGTLCSKFPLEQRKIIKKVISGWIILIILAIVIWTIISQIINTNRISSSLSQPARGLAYFLLFSAVIPELLLFLALVLYRIIYEIFYYKFYFYDLTEKELIIRKGVIARREVVIPFSRIQDVYVDQDFWDRIFGLYDIHVATAATGGAYAGSERAHIDGVNAENAESLKKIFVEKIRITETTKSTF